MNDLGAAGTPVRGGWFRPDPADEQAQPGGGADPLQVEPGEDRQTAGRPRDMRD